MVGRLLDEIEAECAAAPRRRGRIQEIADALDEQDRAEFLAALDNRALSAVAIIRVMKRRGFSLSESVVSNYRRGVNVSTPTVQ
jgi:hypothetical protein